jgi:SAM-dependent methyltransferase
MEGLDNPARIAEIRAVIDRKPALRRFYAGVYGRYAASLAKCPKEGLAVELGSGGGFAQEVIPELLTTDVLPYDGVDRVIDATCMPFADRSVRFLCMTNVFHHIPDVVAFLREADRCLTAGGRLLMIDQHPGWISGPVLRYLHHEPFLPTASDWRFDTTGPLSGANGALAWIVFVRDRARFVREFPTLRILNYGPFGPLSYWLSGGLKRWCLAPRPVLGLVATLDRFLLHLSPQFGSFVEIELVRV